ncbi:MAG: cellulose binding domain-containing protein, partial [Thermoleophilia bacterium]
TPTPTPTPTPVPGTAKLAATVTKDSTWTGGFCRTFKLTNSGSKSSTNWKLTFTLPTSVKITDTWSGTATRSGNVVTVTAPSWAATVAPGTSMMAFGFCASGTGEPSAISVIEVATSTTAVATARSRTTAGARAAEKAAKIRHARAVFAARA